ncbi:MAG: molybdopterin molybdotransferase MoeA [Xanthomonadaceae bacterium]|jgi:molybdopterin molybdotransferase|nr:molybdopterin molybdotransferase MoeA [Xanthomonadaceae bacterium]
MTGYDEALATILAQASRQAAIRVPAAAAIGSILAEDIVSKHWLPPFDNAAMDGFALRHADLGPLEIEYRVTGLQAAGDGRASASGDAWEITTGARMPDGFDTVIPVEQVEISARDETGSPARVRLLESPEPGQHVRRRGEDVTPDRLLIRSSEYLQPQHLMMLAAQGIEEVAVAPRPRVALLITGSELADATTRCLGSGQIRDSNGPFLNARVEAAGAEVVFRRTLGDDSAAYAQALDEALRAGAEIVLSTGAVSMGRFDFVPDALRQAGAEILFHKVRIRPGKPLLFARLPNGALYFGLPGNPISSAVGLRFFVEPALRGMLGMPPERPLTVALAHPYKKREGLRFHLRARLFADDGNTLRAEILPGQESFRIAPMLRANAWAVAAEDRGALAAGDSIDIYGLGHLFPVGMEMRTA